MTEPMGERGRQGAAPLGGTDIETVRIALELMSDDPRIPALEALSRIERVVEAADPELAAVPSDEEMYRIFTVGTKVEQVALSTALRVLVSRIRKAREALGALNE